MYNELTQWSGNQRDLSAAATNHLRKLVHKAVIQNLDFGPLPVNLGKDFENLRFGVRDIYISGSVTDQGIRDHAVIVIEQDSSSASALQGLILLAELPNGDYPREDRFRQEAARCVEEWTQAAKSALEQSPPPLCRGGGTGSRAQFCDLGKLRGSERGERLLEGDLCQSWPGR